MKRLFVAIIAVVSLALSGGQAYAQRCLPGMKGLELRGGLVGGTSGDFYLGTGLSVYTGHAHKWAFGVEYLQKSHAYKDMTIPRAQFTAEGGYYLNFLSDASKTFFMSIGGSAVAGYETVNWGKRLLPDGSTLMAKDAFIYGGAVTLEAECYVTDLIVLLANIRERVLWGGSINKFATQFGVGIKFIIN
ncbi:MAG: conjugal transfer protein TraO [Clostridium sp.]|nr:conjugal transfer protein TraO [Clostridium sp.]